MAGKGRVAFSLETRNRDLARIFSRDQIVEFQIRTRPFNRAAKISRNISLIPGQLTAPTVEQHDADKFLATFAAGSGGVAVVGIANWPPSGAWWQSGRIGL